jgi:surface polysaccharide O-acyltransferase-like enzyme
LLIVFVVFIHNTAINRGVNFSTGTEIYQIPGYVQKIAELVSSFTCVAVPLFFILSAYLLYSRESSFVNNLKKKCRTIIMPYFLWIILTITFLFIVQSFSFTKIFFATTIIRNFTIMDWIQAFLGKFNSGRPPTHHHPLVGQFWFLRDLIILNVFFIGLKRIIDKFPAGTFVLLLILWIADPNIYIINTGALLYFSIGYYIVKYNLDYKHIDNIKVNDLIIMYVVTIIARLIFHEYISIIGNINIFVGIIFFIRISIYFIKNEKIYSLLNWLKGYAFWVYALHMLLEAVLIKLSVLIIPMKEGWLLIQYFGVSIVTIILLIILGIILRKMSPKIYGILTGGRI